MRSILAIARTTLAEARAGKLPWAALAMLALAAGAGEFASRLALAEAGQVRLAIGAAVARIGVVALVSAFAVASTVRDRQDGQWRFLFARPVPRSHYVLGKAAGIAMFALAAAVAAGALASLAGDASRAWQWAALLWIETLVTALFAVACAISLAHAVPALAAVAAFYLLARSAGTVLALAQDAGSAAGLPALLAPRLDLFARTEWLLYDDPLPLAWLGLQAVVAIVLFVALAVVDLGRRPL